MAKSRDIADSADVINILDSGGNLNTFVTTFTLPSVDGTAGQVLATDGGGSLSFVSSSSGGGGVSTGKAIAMAMIFGG